MNEYVKAGAAGLIAAVVVMLGFSLVGGNQPAEVDLGGSTSDDWNVGGNLSVTGTSALTGATTFTGEANFDATAVLGGDVTVLSAGATTTSAAEVCDSNVIQLDAQASAITLTLPTVAEIFADCATAAGDHIGFVLENTTSGTGTITVAIGTGMDLQEPDGQNVVIDPDNMGFIDMYVLSGTTAIVRVDETIPAD